MKNFFQKIWHRNRRKEILKLVELSEPRYLDLGCHGGWLMDQVARKAKTKTVYGLDISRGCIDYGRQKYPEYHFRAGDCTCLPFKDNFFDLVTCFEVLEHLEFPRKAVLEIKRCLKKKGELVVLIPTESVAFRFVWWLWRQRNHLLGPGH